MPSEKEKTLQVLGLSLKLGLLFAPNERSRHIRPNTEEMFIKKDVLKNSGHPKDFYGRKPGGSYFTVGCIFTHVVVAAVNDESLSRSRVFLNARHWKKRIKFRKKAIRFRRFFGYQ